MRLNLDLLHMFNVVVVTPTVYVYAFRLGYSGIRATKSSVRSRRQSFLNSEFRFVVCTT
jgi:hypothetical protein